MPPVKRMGNLRMPFPELLKFPGFSYRIPKGVDKVPGTVLSVSDIVLFDTPLERGVGFGQASRGDYLDKSMKPMAFLEL